jgi:hypothetical protein
MQGKIFEYLGDIKTKILNTSGCSSGVQEGSLTL